jgi:ubiquinone/menaquinone biosynthesis C-methylase UbiE
MSPDRIRTGFNRLAPIYDVLGALAFGGALARADLALVPALPRAEQALIVGGGTGRLLLALLAADRAEHITYVDVADAMVARAASRLRRHLPGAVDRVTFVRGVASDLAMDRRFDLVCTPFYLDCFTAAALPEAVGELAGRLRADGHWLVTDFAVPERPVAMRLAAPLVIGALYQFFGLTCGLAPRRLPPIAATLAQFGLYPATERRFVGGLLETALLQRSAAPATSFMT